MYMIFVIQIQAEKDTTSRISTKQWLWLLLLQSHFFLEGGTISNDSAWLKQYFFFAQLLTKHD